jgi:2-polyprenyl-3-methyl-5-hydroxy-6-metoxy-1,4-benzoquinol methylase
MRDYRSHPFARDAVATDTSTLHLGTTSADVPTTNQSNVPCILCGGSTNLRLDNVFDLRFGVPGFFDIRQCSQCRLEQTDPILSSEDLAATYERYYNFRQTDTSGYTRRRHQVIGLGLYRLWVRVDGDISFVLRSGSERLLLDVGCNEGRNLGFYRAGGFAAEGIETNPVAAATARRLGHTVHIGTLSDLERSSQRYDVVVLSNVLEHVVDPLAMLTSARNILKPGGEVWVSCPNADSTARRVFGRYWINWHPPFHITHLTAATLATLLHSAGFEVTENHTISPALWIAQSLLARRFARPGSPTIQMRNTLFIATLLVGIRTLLAPLLFLMNRSGHGDCLLMTAQPTW